MKLVVCSDAHLDYVTAGVSRFEEIERAMRAAAHHAVRVKADAFVFAGDLSDPDSGSATLRAISAACEIARWLAENETVAIWLVGNHDVTHDGYGTSTLSPIGEGVISQPRRVYDAKWSHDLICLPHCTEPVDYAEHLRSLTKPGQPNIVISHLTVSGIGPGEETTEMPRGAERLLPIVMIEELAQTTCVIQGHYHAGGRYHLKDGKAHEGSRAGCIPLYVVGSLARLTFGEEQNAPSFFELEV